MSDEPKEGAAPQPEEKPAAEAAVPAKPEAEASAPAKPEAAAPAQPEEAAKKEAPAKKVAAKKTAEDAEGKPTAGDDAPAGEEGAEAKPEKKEETAADLLKTDLGEIKVRKAKGSKNVSVGIVNILATFNNTKVSFADAQGNIISWSSAGKCNFRGSRKSTAYAAQVVTQDAGRVALSHGLKEVEVRVKGPGLGRDSAIRALQSLGLNVSQIIDVTPVPHNGCRPPKRRRV